MGVGLQRVRGLKVRAKIALFFFLIGKKKTCIKKRSAKKVPQSTQREYTTPLKEPLTNPQNLQ